MPNILKIQGRKTDYPNPDITLQLKLALTALHKDKEYNLSKISGAPHYEPPAIVLHFSHGDGKFPPDQLNVILLLTDGEGHYRATGLSRYDRGDGKPELCLIGDDLQIKVEESADKAIRSIPEQYKVALKSTSAG